VPNTSRNNFVNLATTSRSLLQTELQHKTRGSNSGGGDFRRSCRPLGSLPAFCVQKRVSRVARITSASA
jgi:hypothetical protein